MHAYFVSIITIPCLPPCGQLIANTLQTTKEIHCKPCVSTFYWVSVKKDVIFKTEKAKNIYRVLPINKAAHKL
jgi:hypothetical protein